MKLLAIVPTYNEAANIQSLLERLQENMPGIDVLVVDDGSPDGTADLVEGDVFLLRRGSKSGLGPAYLAGFTWALERDYDAVVQLDADGSHQPEELPSLVERLEGADLVIGSRWILGGRVVNWPKFRELLSRSGNWYVRRALGLRISDSTAGYRIYRTDLLRDLNLKTVDSNGYCFQIDLSYRAHLKSARIAEVPITFVEREQGESKMSTAIVFEALVQTTKWGLRRLPFFSSKKGKSLFE